MASLKAFGAHRSTMMPRFFFDTFDGETEVRDEIGLTCEADTVGRKAVRALPELARVLEDNAAREFWVKVRAEGGAHIFMASLTLQTRWLD